MGKKQVILTFKTKQIVLGFLDTTKISPTPKTKRRKKK